MARLHVVIPALVHAFIKSKTEYPGAMVLGWLSQFAAYGSMYTTIALILAPTRELAVQIQQECTKFG